jgi:predicted negative regulator of RcsB-dependent stress response
MTSEPLYLTLLRQDNFIVTDFNQIETLVPRSQLPIEEGLLTEINEELARITSLANKRLELPPGQAHGAAVSIRFHEDLKRLGELIFFHLFSQPARQRLLASPGTDLFLRLDDQLVHVPWELAFDGEEFLLNKFRIGRQVLTHQPVPPADGRRPQNPDRLKMLIIADPSETLDAAAEEADQLVDMLDTCHNLEVSILGGRQLRKINLLQALNDCDLVHYAGHACFDENDPSRSGWVLRDSVLMASELRRVPRPPLLVFSNACQAGATTRWQSDTAYDGQAFGIGSAFLLAGTQNYIGTFCAIHDAHSATFAADFYRYLLQGDRVGNALAKARQRAYQEAATSGLLWASYMHYGNPAFHLPFSAEKEAGSSTSFRSPAPEPEVTLGESVLPDYAPREAPLRSTAPPIASPDMAATASTSLPRETSDIGVSSSAPEVPINETPAPNRQPFRLVLSGAVVAVLIALAVFYIRMQNVPAPSTVAILHQAYEALEKQDWDKAKTLFQQLRDDAAPESRSQGYAGLAAIAYAERDSAQANQLTLEAQALNPNGFGYTLCGKAAVDFARGQYQRALDFAQIAEIMAIPYCDLIRGHILAQQGDAAAATAAYQRAVEQPNIPPWQRTIAHNRLEQLGTLKGVTRPLQDTAPQR